MRHAINHVLENFRDHCRISVACGLVFDIPVPDAEPGDFVDADGPSRWCPKCLAFAQGKEADIGLHPDVGVTEDDGEIGQLEGDDEIGQLEVEEGSDSWVGSDDREDTSRPG